MHYYPDVNYPDGDYPDYPDDQGNRRPFGCYNVTLKPGFQDFGRGAFYGSLWRVRVSIDMHMHCRRSRRMGEEDGGAGEEEDEYADDGG